MAISQDLMLALLSLDSYNRGYGQGITLTGNQVGTATVGLLSTDPSVNIPNSQASGYFASAYTRNGKTIISYRGTNSDSAAALVPDVVTGWVTGLGVAAAQANTAAAFYTAVTGNSINGAARAS
jgi:hypothetical protein